MRVCAIVKYPPIQGGVSAQSYWLCRALAQAGHDVHVVTNADEVEDDYRLALTEDDRAWLEPVFIRGRVRVHRTERMSPGFMHIPQSNPFVTKLAGVAADVVREHGCEALFSYYLEPYGVAAHLASHWTGVPYVVRNAGSDVGRLMNREGLATTYREVLRHAHGVCAGSPFPFLGMGLRPEQIYPGPRPHLVRDHFNPDVAPLELGAYIAELDKAHPGVVSNQSPLDPALPVIGVYGKMGIAKGSYDLLSALGSLRREGLRFQLVALTRGRGMRAYLQAIEDQGLSEVTWVLPFVAHWKVAQFIRACRAVCFLERDFPITFHAPTVPREILACGTCLIVSGEIAAKQRLRSALVSGEGALVVPDPKVHADLAAALRLVITDRDAAEAIGRRGAALLPAPAEERDVGAEYARILADVIARGRGEPSAFSLADRGLPPTRAAALREMLPPLFQALGDGADAALEAFLAASPPPASLFDDAADFCRWVASRGGDRALQDAVRYCELLLWTGRAAPTEVFPPAFDRPDVWQAQGSSATPESLRRLAPLRSAWMRVERFAAPLPGLPVAGLPASEGEQIIVFHRLPNLNGHHFRINERTAELLGQCDGELTVDEIIARSSARTGRPQAEVSRAVVEALRRFHREGIIALVEPQPSACSAPGR